MNNSSHELFCLTDPLFYDTPGRNGHFDFPHGSRPTPNGWAHQASDTWMHYGPPGRLPKQGWKIHVSARAGDAERVLDAVWDYCVPRGLAFKFLRGPQVLVMQNAKSAPRGSSGKLVTIYPVDQERLRRTLADLDGLLRGVQGPYILSDLRYGSGPLFVRYGGFAERYVVDESGERVYAMEDGEGRLVPDVRGTTFATPPWVPLPDFLRPHLEARNSVTTEALPYSIESVLHFSNGGGVYLARDAEGTRVVLKEARPHAGLDASGRDAVARLAHERDILLRLAGLDCVPRVLGHHLVGEHEFLALEFVDGNPLQRQLVHRYPLTRAGRTAEQVEQYASWALSMIEKVERAVAALHSRGVVFGDLHPNNVLVTADDRLVLIDFEAASLASDQARAVLGHPAFSPPPDRRGLDTDRYALACLRIGMFAPQLTIMLGLDRAKSVQLARMVSETFPAGSLDEAVGTLLGAETGSPVEPATRWPLIRDQLARSILAAATLDRDDRLFPGDPAQFRPGGGISLAYGAAGVLHALAATGAGRSEDHEEWLRKRALRRDPGTPAGFYDGLHGVAYVLDGLGHTEDALDLIDACPGEEWESLDISLYSGVAGVGLNLLRFGRVEEALRAVEICADRLPAEVSEISGGREPRAGLMYGSAGQALLFLHAYEATADTALLDLAATALRQDVRRCAPGQDGSLQVNQGWRTLPYLDEGSAGIALVLARYLSHREDEGFRQALRDILPITDAGFFVQPGLFTGRAGIIAAAAALGRPVGALLDGLRWHALNFRGGVAFPGDQLLRLSMDFATGTAGVLYAWGGACHDTPAHLPFVQPHGTSPTGAVTAESPARVDARRAAIEFRKEV
ncbi:class III lanthionine synthetase LanKC [Streptosporangiaceae bacterium NEAU-GS5]|nr:class III lanthionine synthetase LanKC [Streptosporangiaceae bacterium NEAU-GS5]